MQKRWKVVTVTLVMALAAFGVRLNESGGLSPVAKALAEPEVETAEPASEAFTLQPGLELKGITRLINFGAADIEQQIELAWNQFYQLTGLHRAVDWSGPVRVYAHYAPSSKPLQWRLTLGYENLGGKLKAPNQSMIPAGGYRRVKALDPDGVADLWMAQFEAGLPEGHFVEAYRLDRNGEIQEAELWLPR